jgi:thiol-disulfide isomerase/thioredoxin
MIESRSPLTGSRRTRRVPRAWRCLFAIGLVMALGACGAGEPEVTYARGGGATWEELRGRWLLINYWAEWCAPCRKEIPELNELQAQGDDLGLLVLGVNFDALRGDALISVMDRMDVQFPVLVDDPRARWELPPPSVLPSTLVIDPDGNLHDVLVGPQTFESLAAAIGL